MVNILTGTPFDAPKRFNHRDDEGALEFPSSVSSRARGLLALKAQNWRAAKKDSGGLVKNGLTHHWSAIDLTESIENDLWTDTIQHLKLTSPWGLKNLMSFNEELHEVRTLGQRFKATIPFGGAFTVEWCGSISGFTETTESDPYFQCNSSGLGSYSRILGVRTPSTGYNSPGKNFSTTEVGTIHITSDSSIASIVRRGQSIECGTGSSGNIVLGMGMNSNKAAGPFYEIRVYDRVLTMDEMLRNDAEDSRVYGVAN